MLEVLLHQYEASAAWKTINFTLIKVSKFDAPANLQLGLVTRDILPRNRKAT